MPSAEAVARYFLHLAAATEEPSLVTQMQLHKLLYYAQGWCLATRERPLFPARFEAWVHGPVEAGLRPRFADYESHPIAPHEAMEDPSLSPDDRAIVESIWLGYGRFSAWKLREMTHNESPWKDARGSLPEGGRSSAPITEAAIAAHFRVLQATNCKRLGLDAGTVNASLRAARAGETVPLESLKADHAALIASRS